MNLTLNNNSLLARLYAAAFTEGWLGYLPNNLCNYFWGLVWATLWLPMTWWTYRIKPRNFDKHVFRILTGLAAYAALFLVCLMGYDVAIKCFNQGGIWAVIWGLPLGLCVIVAIVLVVMLVAGICAGCKYLWEKHEDKQYKKGKKQPNILWAYHQSQLTNHAPLSCLAPASTSIKPPSTEPPCASTIPAKPPQEEASLNSNALCAVTSKADEY